MSVVVAVVTYRRPDALRRLLTALPAVARPRPTRVLVVDNDPAGSARPVVEAAATAGLGIEYVVEPEPGIAAARNRALQESAGAEFCVFIDDDEVPGPGWLEHLLAAQADFDADLVAGPVISEVEGGPGWLVGGGFFDQERRRRGPGPFLASSANLLIRLSANDRIEAPPFDHRFGLTGGSDTLYSLKAQRAGLRMAWADDALVTEFFPAERANPRWLLRRAYRCGTAMARCELVMAPTRTGRLTVRLLRGAKGCAHLALATVKLPASLPRGRAGLLRTARQAWLGAGMVAGATGFRYVEYRRVA